MRGRGRRCPALLAALALTGCALLLPATGAGAAQRADGPAETALRVTVTSLSPVTVTPDSTVTVHGTVTNTTAATLDELAPTVGLGRRVDSRSDLLGDFSDPPGLSHILAVSNSTAPSALGPGASVPFSFDIRPGDADLPDIDTVYPLEIRFDSEQVSGLGRADTFLPYFAGAVAAPLRICWLWPIDAAPVLAADGTISDAAFPADLSPASRLGRLVALATPPAATAAQTARVTWVIEPSLLAAAEVTSGTRWRRTGSVPTATQAPDPASAAFLTALSAATAGQEVAALPYADPDAVALTRAGLSLDLTTAVATGNALAAQQLPGAKQVQLGFPVNGAVDQATLDAYAAAGVQQVVVAGSQLPGAANSSPPTSSAVGTLPTEGPTVGTLSTDVDVQTLVAAGGRDQPTAAMAAQRLLALLATIVAQAPNQQGLVRDVVIAPARLQDPESAWARDVLKDTGSVQWLQPIGLSATTDDPTAPRGPLQAYPTAARAAEIPQSTLVPGRGGQDVSSLRALVVDVATMINQPAITSPLNLVLTRAESLAWRTDPAGSAALRTAVRSRADALLSGVKVSAAGDITLASRTGTIPVTVQNNLPEAVTIRISLTTPDRTKLSSPGGLLVTVPARHKQREQIPAKTQRAGTFRVQLQVTTPNGHPVSAVPLVVHSRAYGAIAVAITVVALGVLVLALLIRTVRRVRARGSRRGADPQADGG